MSIDRLNKGRESIELYETLENLQNVRNKYFEIMELLKAEEKVLIVDGNRQPEIISNEIWDNIANWFD